MMTFRFIYNFDSSTYTTSKKDFSTSQTMFGFPYQHQQSDNQSWPSRRFLFNMLYIFIFYGFLSIQYFSFQVIISQRIYSMLRQGGNCFSKLARPVHHEFRQPGSGVQPAVLCHVVWPWNRINPSLYLTHTFRRLRYYFILFLRNAKSPSN